VSAVICTKQVCL